jgi:trigger factor
VKTDIQTVSDTRKTLVVSLDQPEVAAERKEVVALFAKQVRLPGFRPGHVPVGMVERRWAKEIEDEFKKTVVSKAYRSALEETKLEPLNVISVNEGTIEAGQPASISITVDLAPEFELPDYNGIATTVKSEAVTDAEVEAALTRMRGERADFKTVERAAQKGDYVKLSYTGAIDGKPVAEIVPDKKIYGHVPQTWEEVEGESEGLLPGLGKLIGGLKAGDKKTVGISFPTDFAGAPALAGKDAEYAIEVLEVRERVLPELNEAFFKEHRVDNLDALKERIRENLAAGKKQENRESQRQQVRAALTDMATFHAPQSLVDAETQAVLRDFIEENLRRGVPQEQLEKDKQQLVEAAAKAGETRVKLRLLLARIAEAEKITATEEDIRRNIYLEAMATRAAPAKLLREVSRDRERVRVLQQNIIFARALELVVSKAKTTEASA